jgi:hypothetical protein
MRGRPSSRLSVWSKNNRDSDNASLLTVDEITEDLEKRRLSRTSWMGDNAIDLSSLADASADSEANASSQLGASRNSLSDADVSRQSEGLLDVDEEGEEEDEEEDDAEDDDGEEEEEEEEEEEDSKDLDVPQTVTTTTSKSSLLVQSKKATAKQSSQKNRHSVGSKVPSLDQDLSDKSTWV